MAVRPLGPQVAYVELRGKKLHIRPQLEGAAWKCVVTSHLVCQLRSQQRATLTLGWEPKVVWSHTRHTCSPVGPVGPVWLDPIVARGPDLDDRHTQESRDAQPRFRHPPSP